MKTIVMVTTALALLGTARADNKPLAQLNELSKSMAAKVTFTPKEVDVAEVVAMRDSVRIPSPQAIAYAAALETAIADQKVTGLTRDRAQRVLLDLALDLAAFGGPEGDAWREMFSQALDIIDQVKPGSKPRPELRRQLEQVGAWAAQTATTLSAKLPQPDQARARVRLAMERGRYDEVVQIAQSQLHGAKRVDPIWQGWLAAAFILNGKGTQAAQSAAAAQAAGGEADRLVKQARARHMRQFALERAPRALKAVGINVVGAASGGSDQNVEEGCRKLFAQPTRPVDGGATTPNQGAAAVECATVLWDLPSRDWLSRAAELVPPGAPGAAVRATAQLFHLLPEAGAKRPDEAARKPTLERYLDELKLATIDNANDRRVLALLGYVGASPSPLKWQPSTPDEKTMLSELPPCDPQAFALRAVAARPIREKLGQLVVDTVKQCVDSPSGGAVSRSAVELYLQLQHEEPSVVKADLEPQIQTLARTHENDAEAVAAHADLVALKALAHGAPRIALEAALSRYEQAIAVWQPTSGGGLRQRLESNAAFLSLAIGRTLGEAQNDARANFYLRAAGHLRMALALGEVPAITANRALYDLDTGTGTTTTTLDLMRLPPSRSRNRAACLMAKEASARGDAAVTQGLLALATQKLPTEDHKVSVPELLVETGATLSVILDEARLRPAVDLRTALWLAPACDPATIRVPPPPPAKPAKK
jgi:hypothetical protein